MDSRFHYDFYSSLYDNIQRYTYNRNIWNEDDFAIWNSLNIQDRNVGPERKKWKILFDHIEIKVIKSRNN